jgi:Tol biopolymer transport system component
VFIHANPALPDSVVMTVSPDGTHLSSLGLFSEEAARWSPDGTRLAIPCCDAAAAIVNPDNEAIRRIESPDPALTLFCSAWSPDAKRLACGSFSDDPSRNGIYTIRTSDGRGLTRITSNPAGLDFIGDWSPDGKRLVSIRLDSTRPDDANEAIFVVNVDGSGLRRISQRGSGMGLLAGWSPDGRTIAFSASGRLYAVHPDGTGLAQIVLGGIDPSSVVSAADPSWSPDGTKIVFEMRTAPSQGGTASINIFTANADGGGVQQVTHDTSITFQDDSPDWGTHPLAT